MYNDTHIHTTNAIILLCEANRGGAKPFITLFCIDRERMLCSTYWNVDKNVYICVHNKFTFHDTQKIPRKIYAPFACLKGKMIAMKKHFHIQSIHVCLLCNLYVIEINKLMWYGSYSIRSYTNQSLDMKRKSFYTASE